MFQILVNLLRGKFVAVVLGPEGMGISALFTAASTSIQRFSQLGLNLAIVKEVSVTRDDAGAFVTAMGVARKLLLLTSLLGALVCVLFSVPLSRFTFGDETMSNQFMLLGVAVFFTIAGAGLMSMLQGMHEVKRLSKASLVGSLSGLLAGVPLYYFFGNSGIVPAMCILAIAVWLFYTVSLRKATEEIRAQGRFRFVWQEHKPIVKRLLVLGLLLMASDVIGSACTYLTNTFVRYMGSVDTVGLFQAANSVTNQYVGVVFTAMSLDYFPRLSAVAHSNRKMGVIVNRQLEIVSLIVAPAVAILILSAPLIIRLLLDSRFLGVTELMRWMGLAILFKAIMFPLGYISFAKNNKRLFFWLEGVTGNLLTLTLSVGGFAIFGLMGLAYGMLVDCLICLIIYLIVNHRLYDYKISKKALRGIIIASFVAISVFIGSMLEDEMAGYVVMAIITLVSIVYSLRRIVKVVKG